MWKRLYNLPFNIVNHQTIIVDNLVYVIGGSKNPEDSNNRKISVFLISESQKCTKLKCRSFSWSCRTYFINLNSNLNDPFDCYGHTVVKWNRVGVLFGGCHTNIQLGHASRKIYLFVPNDQCLPKILKSSENMSLATNYWIVVDEIGGNAPIERDGHSSVIWNDNMFLFGGLLGSEIKYFDNKLYQLNLVSWQWTTIYNGEYVEPLGRDFCTLIAHGNALYLFGGRSDDGIKEVDYNDIYDTAVWKYDLNVNKKNNSHHDSKWIKYHPGYGIICNGLWITPPNENITNQCSKYSKYPFPRRSHMSIVSQNEIIIFGGLYETYDFSVHFSDLWSFNIYSCQWTLLSQNKVSTCQIEKPPSLRRGSLTLINENFALLIGGVTSAVSESDTLDGKMMGNCLIIPYDMKLPNQPNRVISSCLSKAIHLIPITLYQQPHTTFLGSITMVSNLSLKSVNQIFLLQPQLSLYQRSLYVVVNHFSLSQLRSYAVPKSVMSDLESFGAHVT